MLHQIYIVEDHPVMRQAYATLINRTPSLALCGTALSAEEALRVLPGIVCDLVVADVSLPGVDGIEFVRRLTALRPHLPTVVISGHDDPSIVRQALEAGARRFLSKDDLAGHFVETLQRVLEEATPQNAAS